MSSDKSGSPPCGIYVRIDDFSNMLDVIGYIRKMAFAINRSSGYKKNMVVVELAYSVEVAERITDIIPVIRDQGFVAIVSGTADPLGADGVLLTNMDEYKALRGVLGDDVIIGLVCENMSEAEIAVKHDVDYVVLAADPMLIGKFTTLSDVLCVVQGGNITNKNCGALARAGAKLVDVGAYILGHEKGPMQGAVNILYELELAAQVPKNLH
ncbi:MAG: hypothetical protein COA45_07815 [Zetaproteobacteria bacterium]|nr:MAG: hypothetical protein COA45_07815 [Zetaproteobacteria bacterium]